MIIQILNAINDDIKQIRIDVFINEQGFENEFDDILNELGATNSTPEEQIEEK